MLSAAKLQKIFYINKQNNKIMKNYSLKELNQFGTLIMSFSEPAYERDGLVLSFISRPIACYLHFYDGQFIVTSRVNTPLQRVFSSYKEAVDRFVGFVSCVAY